MADHKTETVAAKADEAKKTDAPAPAKASEAAPAHAVKAEAAAPAKAAAAVAAATKTAPARAAKAAPKARTARQPKAVKAAKPARHTAAKAASTRRQTKTAIHTSHKINEGTRTMKNEANKMADRAQAVFGDVNARAKSAFERNARFADELNELSKGNVAALVASTKVAARGVETIGQEVAELSRRSFEEVSAALRSFAEVKSPTDFFRLQGDFARGQFDAFVSEGAKMSEAMIKLAGDVAQPLTNRYTVAAEKVKTAVAL